MRLTIFLLVAAVIGAGAVIVLAPADDTDPYPRYDGQAAIETSVSEIVDVPPLWVRKPVVVSGAVEPLDGDRFVLRDGSSEIIVVPEPGTLDAQPDEGDELTVIGVVSVPSRLQAAEWARDARLFISADRIDA